MYDLEVIGSGDGHIRRTDAEDFRCHGGDEETHECAVEAMLKTREDLQRHGHSLDTAEFIRVAETFVENYDK